MDFTPITTQEQFEEAIKDRLNREKDSLGKKYEGYTSPADLEKIKSDYDKQISDLTKASEVQAKKYADYDKQIAERDAKIKGYESASVKTRIAHETGLSYEAIEFLKGDDEDSIRKSAESLKGLVGMTNVAPLASTESNAGDATDAALRNTLKGLKGE